VDEDEMEKMRTKAFMGKFFSYIVYLMVSLYLSSFFNKKIKTTEE
jgi:hypothetical protein